MSHTVRLRVFVCQYVKAFSTSSLPALNLNFLDSCLSHEGLSGGGGRTGLSVLMRSPDSAGRAFRRATYSANGRESDVRAQKVTGQNPGVGAQRPHQPREKT